jgi:NAD(P)H-hydrate epimerase
MSDGLRAPAEKSRRARFVTGGMGRSGQAAAIAHAGGDLDKVAMDCAAGVAESLLQTYSVEEFPRVFLVCGSGFNGAVGMHTAVAIKRLGFSPTVYFISGLPSQIKTAAMQVLKDAAIPTCDFVPSALPFYYDLVVDALLGVGFDGSDIRQHYWNVFEMLMGTDLPLLSVDFPSGWDLDVGPRKIDFTADTFVKPDTLVSLGVPKNGSKVFAGSYHFIGGRHLPQSWVEDMELDVPTYPGSDANSVIFMSTAGAVNPTNGEMYGRPGQFQATLYTKTPRRKWVSDDDIENDPDMWDEMD